MAGAAPVYLEIFPWRAAELESGERYDFAWRYELPITADELWPYIIDSSRFNRAVGYDGISYSEENGLLYGIRGEGKAREEWIEYPFEWTKPWYVHRMRKYTKGFITFNKTIFYIEKTGGGCAITVYIGNISSHPLARKLVPGFIKPFEDKYRAAFDKIVQAISIQSAADMVFDLTRLTLSDDRLRLLDRLIGNLPETPEVNLKQKLRAYILGAEMDALAKIRPLILVDQWHADADATLNLFLQATRAGIFNLTWNTVCPHCRGQRDSLPTLGSVPLKSRCDVCDVTFEVGEDNSVEVNFKLNSQIADLPSVMYCAAEPSKKQHILVQRLVEPGLTQIPIVRPAENTATRVRYQTAIEYRPAEISGKVDWRMDDGALPTLNVQNHTDVGVQLVYETMPWEKGILTPARLFRLQEFRDLFSEEHLSTELQLDVGEQTIMFTDLVGSTRFYEEAGDAQAFGTLRHYFQTIYREARRENGAIVKTIGDGAMLVFADPFSAVTAGMSLIEKFGGSSHALRVTIHSGRCLAVNLNTGIDYFGRTVNLAAKLQTACSGQEILCTSEIYEFQGVRDLTEKVRLQITPDIFEHPSFAKKIPVYRLQKPG